MSSLNGGYAMIKYNSTQEELQIAYRSKRPVLFYDENQRSHWAVIEEKATESVDEETQEPITIYEYSYKLINDIEALVDNKGNHVVDKGTGKKDEEVILQLEFSKWYLIGDILSLEVAGYYTSNISEYSILVYFEIPEYILNRITTAPSGAICLIQQIYAANVNTPTVSMVYIHKYNNSIRFITPVPITITEPVQFRIHCDLLLK